MTRLCAVCKQVLGEKCARCGAEATPLEVNARGHALVRAEFFCPACGHRFSQGDGGPTGCAASVSGSRDGRLV